MKSILQLFTLILLLAFMVDGKFEIIANRCDIKIFTNFGIKLRSIMVAQAPLLPLHPRLIPIALTL
jgi:hypothetical protein